MTDANENTEQSHDPQGRNEAVVMCYGRIYEGLQN
ncbi:MAG: hypothetical protein ACJA2A_002025 [Cycloclasticus pugetii]|jgi:hypothetical protein